MNVCNLSPVFKIEELNYQFTILGHSINARYRFWGLFKPPEDRTKGSIISHIEFRDSPVVSSTGYKSHFFQPELLKTYSSPNEAMEALALEFMKEMGTDKQKPQINQLSLF